MEAKLIPLTHIAGLSEKGGTRYFYLPIDGL